MRKNKTVFIHLICLLLLSLLSLFACVATDESNTPYTPDEFPLTIELDKTQYKAGDTVTFTLTITNQCGKDVNLYSNGAMPCADFQNIENRLPHAEITPLYMREFQKNEKLSREFSYLVEDAGTYILDAHYEIAINNSDLNSWFREKLDDIEITVTP
ncbi:MAG: hypothetical protein LBM60_05720 [Clostridium sp.]|jgi:hypothetical protein|nr:hypothetical protein [Clostridium sp.]